MKKYIIFDKGGKYRITNESINMFWLVLENGEVFPCYKKDIEGTYKITRNDCL